MNKRIQNQMTGDLLPSWVKIADYALIV